MVCILFPIGIYLFSSFISVSERWLSVLFLWPTYCCYLEWYHYLNFSKERLLLPYTEKPNKWGGKKNREVFLFSAMDLKIFPIPWLSSNIWELGRNKTKCTGWNRGREGEKEKGKKREGEEGGRRETKQGEGTTQADVPLLAHAPTCRYGIYKPAALLDAKHPWFSDFSAEDPPNFAAHM